MDQFHGPCKESIATLERELSEARAKHERLLLKACGELVEAEEECDRLRGAIATYIGKVEAGTDDPNALVDLAREQQALAGGEGA